MMHQRSARPKRRALVGMGMLVVCIFAPSLWMIAKVPPLWRDADAYNQLTRDPLISTFWGWQTAYGYLSKVPLLLTEQIELSSGHAQLHSHPPSEVLALSDSGIASLIIAQHLALGISALGFIRAITSGFWLRLVLSLGWASNALFYTFAHCVGSESLSLILIVFLVTRGVRLVKATASPVGVNGISSRLRCGSVCFRARSTACLSSFCPQRLCLSRYNFGLRNSSTPVRLRKR